MIVAIGRYPSLSNAVNGLTYIGPIHYIGSWAFLAFIATHVYLTTTGHTPLASIKAMITGYDDLEVEEKKEENETSNNDLSENSLIDLVKQGIQKFKKTK